MMNQAITHIDVENNIINESIFTFHLRSEIMMYTSCRSQLHHLHERKDNINITRIDMLLCLCDDCEITQCTVERSFNVIAI
jgi:hypothetical protein